MHYSIFVGGTNHKHRKLFEFLSDGEILTLVLLRRSQRLYH
jgi:hypothetical protein